MAKVKVSRCPIHDRFMFNGVCLSCRKDTIDAKIKIATALAKDKVAGMRAMTTPSSIGERNRQDELRRQAITRWWEMQSLRDFIARKREALTAKGNRGDD